MDSGDISTTKRVTLLIATLSAFLTPFMASALNIALPSIGKEFALDAVLLSWVPTSYSLAAAMFLVPFGKLADIYGRKRIFTYGILTFTLAVLLAAVAPSAVVLLGARVLQGIGGAMIFGTSTAMLTSVYPAGERGRALGINVASTYSGLSLGPVLGGFLTQYGGWRSIFWATVPLALLAAIIVLWKLKGEWAEAKGERFDLTGSILYGLSLVPIMYGLGALPSAGGAALILAGVLGLLLFIGWETRTESPILDMRLFRGNPVFALSNLAALINYSATSAVGFLLSLYLQYIKALSPQEAGLVLIAQPVIMAILSPFAGRLSDKVEPRIVASAGMSLAVAGLLLLNFVTAETSLAFIIVALLLLGFSFALFSSPNTNAVMSSVEKKSYGVASATLGTMRLTGQMLSMGIAMVIFAVYMGKVQIMPEYYPAFLTSIRVAFTIFAVLCLGGVFASLARGKVRQNNP